MIRKTNKLPLVKNKSKQLRFLTCQEVKSLLAACDITTNRGKRDLALLKILLFPGLRVDELVTLSSECIVRDTESQRIVALMGTHRTRVINVPEEVGRDLNTWLDILDQYEEKEYDRIFVRILKSDQITNMYISSRHVRNIVAEYGHKAGLSPKKGNDRLKPTDLRRTCGRNAYDNGARLLDVQALLGHSRPLTTARFIDVLKDQNPNLAVDCVQY